MCKTNLHHVDDACTLGKFFCKALLFINEVGARYESNWSITQLILNELSLKSLFLKSLRLEGDREIMGHMGHMGQSSHQRGIGHVVHPLNG